MRLQLTTSSSLETLKKEAKRWLKAVQANDAVALHRLQETYPQSANSTVCLRDIQHALALEYRASSWKALTERLQSASTAGAGEPPLRAPYRIDYRENTIAPNKDIDDSDWDIILSEAENQRISTINAGPNITDAALNRLSRLGHVTTLLLGSSKQLTEEGLKCLENMPQLQVLEIGGAVTDSALETLRQLPELRSFQMCWQTGVSDAGTANLAFCHRLESVNLMGSTTGDGAIAALAGKSSLRRLKTGRSVTDEGLKHLHHIPIFKTWSGGNPGYSLMSAEADPTHLVIDGPFTDEGVSSLVGPNCLSGLYGLSFFWHCTSITPRCLSYLAEMPNLGFLGIEGKLCNDEAMNSIATLPHLKMLMAQGAVATQITDRSLAILGGISSLESIAFWGCAGITDGGLRLIAALPSLRNVTIEGMAQVTEAGTSMFPALVHVKYSV